MSPDFDDVRDITVIGAGPVGLSAAFWATQANFLLGVVGTGQAPTDAKRPVGVISLIGGYGGLHPL